MPVAVQEEQQSTSGANPLSESTVAQDETMTDDSENTDYDISAVPESGIETTSEAQIQVDLSEILNSFLRDDLNNDNGDRGTRSRLMVADDSIVNVEGENDTEHDNEDGEFSNMRGETGDTTSESGDDSVSNASDQEGPELEEEEEASENEDEGDEHSDLDVDEETRQFIEMYDQNVYSVRSPNIPELERDNEDILMIQYNANSARGENDTEGVDNPGGANGAANNAPTSSIAEIRIADLADRRPFSNEQNRRRLEQSRADAGPSSSSAGANDESQATVAAHPLLVRRHSTSQSNEGPLRYDAPGINRGSRSGRQRRFNYIGTSGRGANPPIILQRLLGPSSTNGGGTVTLRAPNGVVLMDNFNLISNNDDENGEIDLSHGHVYNRGLSNHTNNNSTALNWWFEESRILGLESQPDVCLTICDQLVPDLEKYKAQDLAKSRSKRKKKVTEEQEKNAEGTNVTSQGASTSNAAPEETETSQNPSQQVRSDTEFTNALDLMDVSEQPFHSSTPIVNQNINATSTQLEEMQINPDAEPRQGSQATAVQENQANNQAETTSQVSSRQSNIGDGDSEMNDASSMRPQSGETFESLNAESFFLEESEDSVDDNLHNQRMLSIFSDEGKC